MQLLLMAPAAILTAAIAVYAQYRIPRFTVDQKVPFTRAILLVVGGLFGYLMAASFPGDPVPALLAFVIGFGTVHAPAALILFVKQERGSGKS